MMCYEAHGIQCGRKNKKGKKIMDIKLKGKNFISSYTSAIVNCNLFVSDLKYHALYEIDIEKKLTRLCGVFNSGCRHKHTIHYGDELWLLPESNKAGIIDIYNIGTMCFESISLSPELVFDENCRFSDVFQDEMDSFVFWCMPCCASEIVKIDVKKRCIEMIPMEGINIDKDMVFISSLKIGSDIYICEKNRAYVYKYNLSDGMKCIYRNDSIKYSLNKMIVYNNHIYLIPRVLSNPWIKIGLDGDYEGTIDFGVDSEKEFYTEVQFDNTIWAMPYLSKEAYKFDISIGKFEKVELVWENGEELSYWLSYRDEERACLSPVDITSPFLIMNTHGMIDEIATKGDTRDLEVLLAMINVNKKEWR